MRPIMTAFEKSPDGGQGLARDMRVRWAFEEVGQPYEVRLVSFKGLKAEAHRERNPFGQIPTLEEDGLVLFETGAIVLRIAEQHPGLLPADPAARARAIMWMFAAVSTMEPPIIEREQAGYSDRGKSWYSTERFAFLEERIGVRLGELSARLGENDWLDGDFSAGDLMMVMVLRRADARLLEEFPNLHAYVERGKARPAYQRAFAAQWRVNGEGPVPV
ncbi:MULTISPECIES: glutathione S-transferase family protein [Devosia]|uniref:glutathione S-transferase family protein n=1 Tax=Devosia TaxID=46913 RepID=UPI000CE97A13|nr:MULTISPECIES: glutathione S-transferase family protein [Devosia]AVF04571.1 glutathione S-transferase [Devosia sp. I507]